jgi:two-component system chemotaxis response regulator CheY
MAINILVVDDSAVMRSMIIKTINLCGLEVGEIHEAGNGQEGLRLLKDNWVDLLFIDVNMPVMDGMEMLDKVRNDPETRDLPILIVSTESNQDRIKTIDQKNAGFVHKPFPPEILRSKITGLLGIEQ